MTPRSRTASSGQSGLTLVEVLLALSIIAVALVGLGGIVPVSISGVHEGGHLSTATFLAEQMIERTRAATWTATPPVDCLGASTGNTPPVPDGASCPGTGATSFPDEATGVSGYPAYGRTVRISTCAITACAGVATPAMRLVEVTVVYRPLTGAGSLSSSPKVVRLAWMVAQK